MTKKMITAIINSINSYWDESRYEYEQKYNIKITGNDYRLYIDEAENRGYTSHPFYSLMVMKEYIKEYKFDIK